MYFSASNTYLVLDDITYRYFKTYALTASQNDFNIELAKDNNTQSTNNLLYDTFHNLSKPTRTLDPYRCNPCNEDLLNHVFYLQYKQQNIAINYDTQSTLDIVIHKFRHLQSQRVMQQTDLNIHQ